MFSYYYHHNLTSFEFAYLGQTADMAIQPQKRKDQKSNNENQA